MSGDPFGKRALFLTPAAADPASGGREGKEALFSVGPRRPGTVVIDCSSCGTRTRTPVVEAAVRIMVGSVWLPPVLRHNRWLPCPSCQRRTWCRIEWTG